MLDDDDSIVHITTLDKVIIEKELYLVEENKCPADTDLLRIQNRRIPLSVLYTKHSRIEIHHYVILEFFGRLDTYQRTFFLIPYLDSLFDLDISAWSILLPETIFPHRIDIWLRTTVQDRHLDIIDINISIIHAHTCERGKNMFDCRY